VNVRIRSLIRRTYEQEFIVRSVLVIFAVGFLIAFGVRFLAPKSTEAEVIDRFLIEPDQGSSKEQLRSMDWEYLLWYFTETTEFTESPDAFSTVVLALRESIIENDETPGAALTELIGGLPPTRYAHHAAGIYFDSKGVWPKAAEYYEKEFRLFPQAAKGSADLVLKMLSKGENDQKIEQLLGDPEFREAVSAPYLMQTYRSKKDWGQVFRWLWLSQHQGIPVMIYLLAGIAGSVWLLFLLLSFNLKTEKWSILIWLLLGVGAGVLSIVPTLLVSMWFTDYLGFDLTGDLGPDLVYCIIGIGFKEEACKLLLFLPFVPFLIRRYDPLRIFMVAAAVGLGFAIDENLGYFSHSYTGDIGSLGRLLTANFFHLSATGLCGLAFCRMVRNPRKNTDYFLAVFGAVVLAHGLYDALIITVLSYEFGYFSGMVFILLAYRYFHEFKALHEPNFSQPSLTYVLMCGIALVTISTYAYLVYLNGSMMNSFTALGSSLVAVGIFIIMYLREIPETIG
jgi:RsiW-degrading membrane proteinase PrsW (M82 family)